MHESVSPVLLAKLETELRHRFTGDYSHDFHHARRVLQNCHEISRNCARPCDDEVLIAASYLHDIVTLPKDHPSRERTSRMAAAEAKKILSSLDFPPEKIPDVCHAIEAHSFSANIRATTLEAKILHDADQLDSLGAMGIARTFYTAGQIGTSMFDQDDPIAIERILDDQLFALDHFQAKLFLLPDKMVTIGGRELAMRRVVIMRDFVDALLNEMGTRSREAN